MTRQNQPALRALRDLKKHHADERGTFGQFGVWSPAEQQFVLRGGHKSFERDGYHAPWKPPGSDRPCKEAAKVPKGAPPARVYTDLVPQHLKQAAALDMKRQFFTRDHATEAQPWNRHEAEEGGPPWEMLGNDGMGDLGAEEPRIYQIHADLLLDSTAKHLGAALPEWMRLIGLDLGAELRWAAWIHERSHLHVHAVIRGLDAAQQPVYFPVEYIDVGFRRHLRRALHGAQSGHAE